MKFLLAALFVCNAMPLFSQLQPVKTLTPKQPINIGVENVKNIAPNNISSNIYYAITSKHSGLLLQVRGNDTLSNADLYQDIDKVIRPNGKVKFIYLGGNEYKIVLLHSGKYLQGGSNPGDAITQQNQSNSPRQIFIVKQIGNGQYKFYLKYSNRLFAVEANSTWHGTSMREYPEKNTSNEVFILTPQQNIAKEETNNLNYNIANKALQLALANKNNEAILEFNKVDANDVQEPYILEIMAKICDKLYADKSIMIKYLTKAITNYYTNNPFTNNNIFKSPLLGNFKIAAGPNKINPYHGGFQGYYGYDMMYNNVASQMGQPIYAIAAGKVVFSNDLNIDNPLTAQLVPGAKHNIVIIEHANGLQSLYVHCKQYSAKVKVNNMVVAGQQIAEIGNSGNTTGPHLHFEIQQPNTMTLPFNCLQVGYANATDAYYKPVANLNLAGNYSTLPADLMPPLNITKITTTPFTIKMPHDDRYLMPNPTNSVAGCEIQIHQLTNNTQNAYWLAYKQPNNTYFIKHVNTGLYLGTTSQQAGGGVVLVTTPTPWDFVYNQTLGLQLSNTNQCVDLFYGKKDIGNKVTLYNWGNVWNQNWKLLNN